MAFRFIYRAVFLQRLEEPEESKGFGSVNSDYTFCFCVSEGVEYETTALGEGLGNGDCLFAGARLFYQRH